MKVLENRDALYSAGAVLVVGLALALALRLVGIADGTIFIALLVLPLIVYGVASGMVKEFTAPGGWGAKFREVATDVVDPSSLAIDVDDLQTVEKSSVSNLELFTNRLRRGEPVALSIQLGRQNYYSAKAISKYISALLNFDPALTVIFKGTDGRFVASVDGMTLLAALSGSNNGRVLLGSIERENIDEMQKILGFTTETASPNTSNASALALMLENGMKSIIVVDGESRPIGVVRRDDIVARLLVKLASEARPERHGA